jgi:hypothetical protein
MSLKRKARDLEDKNDSSALSKVVLAINSPLQLSQRARTRTQLCAIRVHTTFFCPQLTLQAKDPSRTFSPGRVKESGLRVSVSMCVYVLLVA